MSARIPDTHAEAWALLPWLANGRLASEDREWVEAHVQGCAECRAELAAQRLIDSHVSEDASPQSAGSDEQRSFNKLWARIEAAESAAAPIVGTGSATVPAPRSSRTVRWLAAAVVVQALGLGALGLAFNNGNRAGDDGIVTVTDTPATTGSRANAPTVTLVFEPGTSIGTINTLLTHQGLSIVAGPGASNNYQAELSADAVASGATADSVAAVMSKDPNVSLAEPVAK